MESCHKPGLLSKILHFDVEYNVTLNNWWPMSTDFPSGKTSNATLTFSISVDMVFAHILGIQGIRLLHILREFCTKLMAFLQILRLPLSDAGNDPVSFSITCFIYQLKAGSWSINSATANSAVYIRWDSFNSKNFSHEVEPSFHWHQICQPAVVLQIIGLPHMLVYCSVREITLLSLWKSIS